MKYDIAIDECDISSKFKEMLKDEGYDSVNKIFCEPVVTLLSNHRVCDYWDELLAMFCKLNKDGTLDRLCEVGTPVLNTHIEHMPINKGIIYILDRAGFVIVSDIWHAGTDKLRSIDGMTDKAFNELISYMKEIGLEIK